MPPALVPRRSPGLVLVFAAVQPQLALWRQQQTIERGAPGTQHVHQGHRLGLPLVCSWHTNVHEYAGARLGKMLPFLGEGDERLTGRFVLQRSASDTAG